MTAEELRHEVGSINELDRDTAILALNPAFGVLSNVLQLSFVALAQHVDLRLSTEQLWGILAAAHFANFGLQLYARAKFDLSANPFTNVLSSQLRLGNLPRGSAASTL